jgi:hypothetical protein
MLVWERLLVDVIDVTFGTLARARSKGPAIELAMFSALAPGIAAKTLIVGKSTSGREEIGS